MASTFDPEHAPYYRYLFKLQTAGVCNMFESGFHLQSSFGIDHKLSKDIVLCWMKNWAVVKAWLEDGISDFDDEEMSCR